MISDLPNLGVKSAEMLARAGITSRSDLEQLGAVRAYLAVKQSGAKPSLNLLWAIAGALSDTHWSRLSETQKQRLKKELDDWLPAEG